jgi:hypothetical protein
MLLFIANEFRNSPLQAGAAAIFLVGLVASAIGGIGGVDWAAALALRTPISPIALSLCIGAGFGVFANLLFRVGKTIGALASFAMVFAIIELAALIASSNPVLRDTSGTFLIAACSFFPFFGVYMQSVNARLTGDAAAFAAIFMIIVPLVAFFFLLPMRIAMYVGA